MVRDTHLFHAYTVGSMHQMSLTSCVRRVAEQVVVTFSPTLFDGFSESGSKASRHKIGPVLPCFRVFVGSIINVPATAMTWSAHETVVHQNGLHQR